MSRMEAEVGRKHKEEVQEFLDKALWTGKAPSEHWGSLQLLTHW